MCTLNLGKKWLPFVPSWVNLHLLRSHRHPIKSVTERVSEPRDFPGALLPLFHLKWLILALWVSTQLPPALACSCLSLLQHTVDRLWIPFMEAWDPWSASPEFPPCLQQMASPPFLRPSSKYPCPSAVNELWGATSCSVPSVWPAQFPVPTEVYYQALMQNTQCCHCGFIKL